METQTTNPGLNIPPKDSLIQFSFFNQDHFSTINKIANMFANSELVPDMYKVSPNNSKEKAVANCIIAIDMANQIGANILMVMQNLAIIYGKPSWSSKFLIGTVNTCGRFEALKFKFEDLGELKNVDYTSYEWKNNQKVPVQKVLAGPIKNLKCYAYTTEKGKTEVLEGSEVTIEMAISEGWYTKNGSKWKTMPRQMLMYRAASFWISTYAPELSLGMKTDDEIRDIETIPDTPIITVETEKTVEQEIDENANKETIDIKQPAEQKKEEKQPVNADEKEKSELKQQGSTVQTKPNEAPKNGKGNKQPQPAMEF